MSNTKIVFSNNSWVSVDLPSHTDPNWTEGDMYYYAMIWALAVSKGFDKSKAHILAEMLTCKRVYPGISFDSLYENDILRLEH